MNRKCPCEGSGLTPEVAWQSVSGEQQRGPASPTLHPPRPVRFSITIKTSHLPQACHANLTPWFIHSSFSHSPLSAPSLIRAKHTHIWSDADLFTSVSTVDSYKAPNIIHWPEDGSHQDFTALKKRQNLDEARAMLQNGHEQGSNKIKSVISYKVMRTSRPTCCNRCILLLFWCTALVYVTVYAKLKSSVTNAECRSSNRTCLKPKCPRFGCSVWELIRGFHIHDRRSQAPIRSVHGNVDN